MRTDFHSVTPSPTMPVQERHFVCEILLKDKLAPSLQGLQHGAGTDSQDTISPVQRKSLDPYSEILLECRDPSVRDE